MSKACRNCKKEISSGIWIESKFKDTPIYIFCSEKCKEEYSKSKLTRIKTEYPKYHEKIMKLSEKKDFNLDKYVL